MITYQQTDNPSNCINPYFTDMDWDCVEGGSAGSTEVVYSIDIGEFEMSDCIGFEITPGDKSWDSGDVEVELNVTTFTGTPGDFGDLGVNSVEVVRVGGSCSIQETLGSVSFGSFDRMIDTGVNNFTIPINGAESASGTDRMIILFSLDYWGSGGMDIGVTPNRTVSAPFSEAVTEIQVDVTDSGSGSDNVSVSKEAHIDATEQAAGQDSVSVNVQTKVEDSGTFSESEHINVNFFVQDSFSATDGAGKTAILLTIEDEAHGSEDIKGQISVIIEDNAQFTDQTTLVLKEIIKRIADNAQFIDSSPHLGVEFTVSDNGIGSDAIGAHIEFTVTDQANATDNIEVITDIIISILDSGSFSDEGGVDTVGLSVKDSATLSDEIVESSVYIKATESAQFQDAIAEITNMLAIIEEATATDAVIAFEEHSRILEITFQLKQKMTIFNLIMKSMDYMLKYKKMEFEYAY